MNTLRPGKYKAPFAFFQFWLVSLSCLLPLAVHAADWALQVTRIEISGVLADKATLQITPPGSATAERKEIKTGESFPVGTTLAVPARTSLTLKSSNSNELRLLPGSRLKITAGSNQGEEYTQEEGESFYDVKRALNFFNVRYRNFQAIVKGTRYSVKVEPQKAITIAVTEGSVKIEREGKLRIDKGNTEGTITTTDIVKAGERKSYRLDIDEYLARFKHYGEAEAYYRQNLERDRRSGDPDRIAIGLNQMGIALLTLSQYQAAIPYFEEWLQSARQRHPDGVHPNIAASLNNLGNAYRNLDGTANLKRAIGYYEEDLKITRQLYPSGVHADSAASLNNLGVAYRALGGTANLERAIGYHEESLKVKRQLYPSGVHAGIAVSLGGLAFSKLFVAQYVAALRDAREGLQIAPDKLWIHTNEAHALLFLGRETEALAIYTRYRDDKVNARKRFSEAVLDDFVALRKAGVNHPGMARVEALYSSRPPAEGRKP